MKVIRGIFRTLAAAAGILVIFFVILPLIETGYQQYYGTDSIYLITGTGLPILWALVLFAALLWLFSRDGLKGYFEDDRGDGLKAGFTGKKKWLAGILAVVLTITGIIGSMCWFQRFTLEGVEYRCFFYKKEYAWQDVEGLILKADFQGSLIFEFHMKNGRKYSFNGGILWCVEYFSHGFEQKFPEDVYDYARWLGRELGGRQVPLEAKGDWDSLMEELEYDSWKSLAEDVRQCYEKAAEQTETAQ